MRKVFQTAALVATALAMTAGAGAATAFAATATSVDFQTHGFPTVAAKAAIPAGQGATITAGDATVTIPAGTFSDAVEFELLEGSLSSFAAGAPSGQTPVFDFAFKVVDQKTGALVMAFQKPVMFSLTNKDVGAKSLYYNIAPTGTYTLNPVKATISGDTLQHPITGAPVGWVVTSPATTVSQATSPVTGFPLVDWLVVGTGLILAGGVLLAVRRKVS